MTRSCIPAITRWRIIFLPCVVSARRERIPIRTSGRQDSRKRLLHRAALNKERIVEAVTRDIWAVVDARIAHYEIILVNDGSTDKTGAIIDGLARELAHVRVLHNNPNIGLGASYQRGVAEAKCDYIMMLCGDGGLPASSLPPIIAKIGTADIVVPFMLNLRQLKTPMRYVVSRSYTWSLNTLFGYRLNYYNGLPVHRRVLLERIEITSSGFGFRPRSDQVAEVGLQLRAGGCVGCGSDE